LTEQQMPIFVRTFDFLTWLLPATNHFPRAHRHTFTARLLDWEWLSPGQYEHVAAMVAEIGRMLGVWTKVTSGRTSV
jgi:hypothetical protein